MITDLRELPDNCELTAHICIIGAGPAGISLAREFIGSGFDVVLVESGGLEIEHEIQKLNEGESAGVPHKEYATGRTRAFGGTGKSWAGQCLRFDGIDFRKREWVPASGWPVHPEGLDRYYQRAEAFFGLAGEVYDSRNYTLLGFHAPAWSKDSVESRFTVYTDPIDIGKKHLSEMRRAENVRLLYHATVVQIELDESATHAVAVRVRSLEGKRGRITARVIVLAAGGLENARLLLSSDERRPTGIGNDHDLVGRFFQDHPTAHVATVKTSRAAELARTFRMFYKRSRRYFPKIVLSPALQEKEQVLNAVGVFTFHYPEDSGVNALREVYLGLRKAKLPPRLPRKLLSIARDSGDIAHVLLARTRGISPQLHPSEIKLQCQVEQAPDPASRVRLSNRRDALGLRQLQVDWKVSPLEIKTVRVLSRAISGELERLGLGSLQLDDWMQGPNEEATLRLGDCAHHMGTTRMSASPANGVVDSNCKVFGVDGLYIAGSSVFPTSSYANPTLTIVALAIRLAEHLNTVLQKSRSSADTAGNSIQEPVAESVA